ncbi:MAG: class I SAM-dependent methyltransferase [Actinomycetota bacterium]
MTDPNHAALAGYDDEFYDEIDQPGVRAGRIVLPLLGPLLEDASVVDVGCGRGSWLAAARDCGARSVVGLDGPHVDLGTTALAANEFKAVDLETPLPSDLGRFDLAISLEVAEHLSVTRAHSFVSDLCRLSEVVLFSAAIPGQGGRHHVNEQWPGYWTALFRGEGFRALDIIRPQIWSLDDVPAYYRQNIVIYAASERVAPLLQGAEIGVETGARDLVHPEIWRERIARRPPPLRPGVRTSIGLTLSALRRSVEARTNRRRPPT